MGLAFCCSSQKTGSDIHTGDWKYGAVLEKEEDGLQCEGWLSTNQDDMVMMVEVQVDYHIENIVKIPPFWKIHGDFLPKTPPFCWKPWTMPQTEKNPLSPCKCGLAYAPLLYWTAVTGILSYTGQKCRNHSFLSKLRNQNWTIIKASQVQKCKTTLYQNEPSLMPICDVKARPLKEVKKSMNCFKVPSY